MNDSKILIEACLGCENYEKATGKCKLTNETTASAVNQQVDKRGKLCPLVGKIVVLKSCPCDTCEFRKTVDEIQGDYHLVGAGCYIDSKHPMVNVIYFGLDEKASGQLDMMGIYDMCPNKDIDVKEPQK